LDAVGTVGRAHGGHEFLFQKWVDNEVLNDFNAFIHNCALHWLICRWSGESQEVLCIHKVGEFVELSKWVSKWGQNGELDGKVLMDVGVKRHGGW